jgi:hypothetical protein
MVVESSGRSATVGGRVGGLVIDKSNHCQFLQRLHRGLRIAFWDEPRAAHLCTILLNARARLLESEGEERDLAEVGNLRKEEQSL